MSELRRRMIEDMRLAGLAESTRETYVICVRNLARYYNRSPQQLSEEEVRHFFLHLLDKGISEGSFRTHRYAISFLYTKTLGQPMPALERIHPRRRRRLPVILSPEEVATILTKVRYRPARMCMWVAYACGLRRSEALRLTASDIDSKRMLVRVRAGKGGKDRYVPLPETLLHLLRQYWSAERPQTFLFPAACNRRSAIRPKTLGHTFDAALRQSSVKKKVSLHTLRHSYATHLLEHKVNLRVIQEALGHTSPTTTAIYTHVTQNSQNELRLALDVLLKDAKLE